MMIKIKISNVRTNGGTQSRAEINETTVREYAEAMQDGAEFPPVVAFNDGSEIWLADGFHRIAAERLLGYKESFVDLKQGTRRDATLYSVGANSSHGLRRTNADKRRAVETLLRDSEWAKWSSREIARQCGVSHMTVKRIREESICNNVIDTPRTVTRNGTTYEQNTANIGKKKTAVGEENPEEGEKIETSDNHSEYRNDEVGSGYQEENFDFDVKFSYLLQEIREITAEWPAKELDKLPKKLGSMTY